MTSPEPDCRCAGLSKATAVEELVGKIAQWGGNTNIKVGAEAAKTKTSIGLLDKEVEETPEAVKEIKV